MWTIIAVILIHSLTGIAGTCPEKTKHIITDLDAAMELMSKAKSNIPKCEEAKMTRPQDCSDLYRSGKNVSGGYNIWPMNRLSENKPILVFCDMHTAGGGWTVVTHKRPLGISRNYFDKDWETYRKGFSRRLLGSWIGNDNIFMLTNQRLYRARYHLDLNDQEEYAECDFWIDNNLNDYTLHVSNCIEKRDVSLLIYNNMKFSTKDKDNDLFPDTNCAEWTNSGWWFGYCEPPLHYKDDRHIPVSEIKIRPANFLEN